MINNLEEIVREVMNKPRKRIAVAAAQDKVVLEAVISAVKLGIVEAILVGDENKIREISLSHNIDIKNLEIIDVVDNEMAAKVSVGLVAKGRADFLMKGMLPTSELLKAVLNKDANIKGEKLLSHVMIYDIPNYHKLLFLTDGGMVPYPDLKEKIKIINNAVEVCKVLGIDTPKVAPICAVETVNPSMQSTVDASILSQMNRRGQIKDCIIDGPLAFDNAISKESAIHKGIISEVAGDADIILVPNIESGNLLGKSFTYFGKAENAGIVVGAKCPIVLVSRTDSEKSKLVSIALGALMNNF